MANSAEISLMKTLSMDRNFVRNGITFNSVAPGSIMISDTGWDKLRMEEQTEFSKLMESDYPIGRLGTPEEVADLIVFLFSDRAALINGATVAIDCGESRAFQE